MTRMKYNIIYLSGRQKEKSYLAAARGEELSGGPGGHQKSYEGQPKITECFVGISETIKRN